MGGGCGFHGSKVTKNYCSICFKKNFPEEAFHLSQKQALAQETVESKHDINIKTEDDKSNNLETNAPVIEPTKPKKKQKKKNRCWICRKKLSLAAQFTCKCDYVFCSQHRYYDAHQCTVVNAANKHKKNLEKNNQKVAASKVPQML